MKVTKAKQGTFNEQLVSVVQQIGRIINIRLGKKIKAEQSKVYFRLLELSCKIKM